MRSGTAKCRSLGQYVPQVQDHCGTRPEGLALPRSDQAYGFEPSRVGFPSFDGRRPSTAAWRIGSR
jgi:hypothetical protein